MNTTQDPGGLPSRRLALGEAQETTVQYVSNAPRIAQPKRIHPRRIIPRLPAGAEAQDPNPSAATQMMPMGPRALAPAAAPDDLVLIRNVELGSAADNQTAADVDEPSVGTNGDVVFYTGNWYAAISTDGGATFRYVDPFHAFPDPQGMGFCCDQVVQYIPSIDTFVWLLQYTQNPAGANIQRLAFATTADATQGRWKLYDITPDNLGFPGAFLDFPDLALGANTLYVTTNVFQGQNWTASALARLPFAGIAAGAPAGDHTSSSDHFTFRVAQNCGTRAFWASHADTSHMRVFFWDEGAQQPSFQDVTVATWALDNYQSMTPDGFNWLGRCDYRMVGAAMAGNELWFGWSAARGGVNNRPQPYAQIARIDSASFAVIDNVNLWDPSSAIAYPALAANANGDVGASYMIGGGPKYPSPVVALLTGTQANVITADGAHGPLGQEWGDYLTVRRNQPNAKTFAATGYTLNGTGSQDGNPRFVLFGRSSDAAQ
jgi:hypothetical protein